MGANSNLDVLGFGARKRRRPCPTHMLLTIIVPATLLSWCFGGVERAKQHRGRQSVGPAGRKPMSLASLPGCRSSMVSYILDCNMAHQTSRQVAQPHRPPRWCSAGWFCPVPKTVAKRQSRPHTEAWGQPVRAARLSPTRGQRPNRRGWFLRPRRSNGREDAEAPSE